MPFAAGLVKYQKSIAVNRSQSVKSRAPCLVLFVISWLLWYFSALMHLTQKTWQQGFARKFP